MTRSRVIAVPLKKIPGFCLYRLYSSGWMFVGTITSEYPRPPERIEF